ncbi:hypothetical protein BDFB_009098 [Asbolus verrucosus]|uniref:Uncharacterized protein n=1 Tax=Asbolus verrucosus TaxID=1661398 RepID=A0A482VV95_ASBVE|nr:hypothetical protein BDFB_009098 [Asbolus verrucosus]
MKCQRFGGVFECGTLPTRPLYHTSGARPHGMMESLEEVVAREEAERQQSLRDLEQLYEWLQQFEDPPATPRPPPPQQFRNGA